MHIHMSIARPAISSPRSNICFCSISDMNHAVHPITCIGLWANTILAVPCVLNEAGEINCWDRCLPWIQCLSPKKGVSADLHELAPLLGRSLLGCLNHQILCRDWDWEVFGKLIANDVVIA